MFPAFKRVWIENEWEHSYLLSNATLFVMISLALRILLVFESCISFIISRVCRCSQSLALLIRWTINIERMFFMFGFIMSLVCWNMLWDMNDDTVRASLILFCIIVCGPVGCVLCVLLCGLLCAPTE